MGVVAPGEKKNVIIKVVKCKILSVYLKYRILGGKIRDAEYMVQYVILGMRRKLWF